MQGFWSECGKFKANAPGGQHVKSESLNLSGGAVSSPRGGQSRGLGWESAPRCCSERGWIPQGAPLG